MRNLDRCFALMPLALLFIACGGSKPLVQTKTGNAPDWYLSQRTSDTVLYATNTATSRDLQLAYDKAVTGARAELARQVEVHVRGLQKRFSEEVGIAEDAQLLQQFTQANKTVVATSLRGSKVTKKEQVKDGANWRAYVMVAYSLAGANKALIEELRSNEKAYTRLRASEAFRELERDVEDLGR